MKKQLLFRLVLVVGLTMAIPHVAHPWPQYEYWPCFEDCCRGFSSDYPEPAPYDQLCDYNGQVKSCGYFYQVSVCA